jgi:hypothetical protein
MGNQITCQTYYWERTWSQGWYAFGDAFPLQFLYGHTGLQTDPAVIELNEQKTIKKRFRHRKLCFHGALFNLIFKNLIMKDTIFLHTQVQCNMKSTENIAMGKITEPCQPVNSKREFKTVDKTERLFLGLLWIWKEQAMSENKVQILLSWDDQVRPCQLYSKSTPESIE